MHGRRPQYWWYFCDGYGVNNPLGHDRRYATDELFSLNETRLAGDQKQNGTFLGSVLSLVTPFSGASYWPAPSVNK